VIYSNGSDRIEKEEREARERDREREKKGKKAPKQHNRGGKRESSTRRDRILTTYWQTMY